MTKKIIAIFAALLLSLSVCACNDKTEETEETGSKINIGTEVTTNAIDETDKKTETEVETVTETETETEAPAPMVFVEQKDTVYVIASTNQVNLRSDTVIDSSTAMGVVANGTALERIAVSEDGIWSKVLVDGEELYIKSTYVTTLANIDDGFVATNKTLTLAGSLYVRIAPSMDNEAIDTLYAGDVVTVVAYNAELGWYKVKFNGTYASEGYIVSASKYFVEQETETSAPQVEITVPENYEAFADTAIAFAYPKGWTDVPGEFVMKTSVTGDNVNVIYQPYTEEFDVYFTMDKEAFEELFLPIYSELGYTVSNYEITQTTKGDTKVAVISFDNTISGISMHMTQYVFVVNSSNVCTLTVTELSDSTTIAQDIFDSLIIAK